MNSKKKFLIDYTTIETAASTKSMRTETTSNKDFYLKKSLLRIIVLSYNQ